MDRAELSEVIIQEGGTVFTAALTAVAPAWLTADLEGVAPRLQDLGRQVLGRVVEQVVAVRAAATAAAPPTCAACGGSMRCVGRARPRQVQGLVHGR